MKRYTAKKGFTLIELLLVIVLLGVVIGLVIPQLGRLFFDQEFYAAVTSLEKCIHYAATQSILTGELYKCEIDLNDGTYMLSKKNLRGDGDAVFEPIEGKLGKPHALPDSSTFDRRTLQTVVFYPDGRTTNGVIYITSTDQLKATITLGGSRGKITVSYQ